MQNDRRLVCFLVQLTYHGLQVIFQHLHITKASAMPSGEGGAAPKPEAPSPMQVRLCAPAVCIAVIMKHSHLISSLLSSSHLISLQPHSCPQAPPWQAVH